MKTELLAVAVALLACGGERADDPPPKPRPATIAKPAGMFTHWTEIEAARGYRDSEGAESAARYAAKVGAKALAIGTRVELVACTLDDTASIRVSSGQHAGSEGFVSSAVIAGEPCQQTRPPK